MNLSINLLFFISIFTTFTIGQNLQQNPKVRKLKILHLKAKKHQAPISQLETRQDILVRQLSEINSKDLAEAKKIDGQVLRLFPCCPLAGERRDTFGMNSGYSFRNGDSGDQYFATGFFYNDNLFTITNREGNHGFFLNIGKFPIENVNEKLPAYSALVTYQPPVKASKVDFPIAVNTEEKYTYGNFVFKSSIAVNIGDTYILRVVNYATDSNLDRIYALKIHHRDVDGSIIIFLKTLKIFDPPKLENLARNSWSITAEFYDVGLLETLRNALRENGFNEISVEPNEHRGFILKGNISVERFKEAFKIIKEIAPTESIKNEIPNIPKSFLNPSYDPELEKMVNEAIQTKGFRDIIFDSSTIPSTLKGTIPKGQTEEVMKIILKLLRKPVINQMVEK